MLAKPITIYFTKGRMVGNSNKGKRTKKNDKMTKHKYSLKIINGRVKVYIDGLVMVSFDQLDFKGYYAYKDDS